MDPRNIQGLSDLSMNLIGINIDIFAKDLMMGNTSSDIWRKVLGTAVVYGNRHLVIHLYQMYKHLVTPEIKEKMIFISNNAQWVRDIIE